MQSFKNYSYTVIASYIAICTNSKGCNFMVYGVNLPSMKFKNLMAEIWLTEIGVPKYTQMSQK